MALSTTQKTIEQLLTGNRQYQIPDFQRPYVWEEHQAIALINDLLDAWRTNDGDYFLGSIVLVEQPSGDNVDIIDGQQRLTTLCVLVSLLRHLVGTDAGLHDEIGQLLSIPESRIKGLDERPRLSVRECDRAFFDTFIVGDNIDSLLDVDANALTPPSVRRIHDNARAMLDTLIDPEALPPTETQNFVQYLMLQVSLIEVTTDSYQAAHRIFSVLNTRGVPLAATDIFKANVLAHVAPERRPRYAVMWEDAINSLATDNPDAFFGHLLTLMLRSPAKRALIDCFSEQVLTPFFAAKSGEQFIDEVLVPNARAYELATLAPLAGHPAATPLELLRLYDSADWKPAAMYVLGTNRSDEDIHTLLTALERIYGTAVAARVVPGTRTLIVTQFISAIEDRKPIDIACSVPDDIRHRAAATIARPLPQSSIRKILLYHAMVAEQHSFPEGLPRSLGVLPGLPTKQIRGIHKKIDTQAWNKRLGGLILTTLKSRTVNQAPDWDTVARACHEVPVVGISEVGALPSTRGEIHESTLEARQ